MRCFLFPWLYWSPVTGYLSFLTCFLVNLIMVRSLLIICFFHRVLHLHHWHWYIFFHYSANYFYLIHTLVSFCIFLKDCLMLVAIVLNVFDLGSEASDLFSNYVSCKLATFKLYFLFQLKFFTPVVSIVVTFSSLLKRMDSRWCQNVVRWWCWCHSVDKGWVVVKFVCKAFNLPFIWKWLLFIWVYPNR